MPVFQRTVIGERVKKQAYKRAVVGLVEPFYYPQAVEDMSAEEREKRQKWLDDEFHILERLRGSKMVLLKMTRKSSPGWNGWTWRTGSPRRSNILRVIAERRALREELIEEAKGGIADIRATGLTDTAHA
ncbi:hypothetical protein NM688_g6226 [Phlebia brevispora]|uniref:Uncharacterized protein n=1 Tax=Phlebia brevispora TaxID=194682 RepID=A0ACC1SIE6_9APHY|nr:hypothetical protein NM688_g6226 [Phlebia brevispora]